jgi:hypothetical protein
VRSLVARSLAILCAIAALSYLLPDRIAGQTLVVPMTGRRVRDIETAQLFHTLLHDFFLEDDATTYVRRSPTFAIKPPTRHCAPGSRESSSGTRATF